MAEIRRRLLQGKLRLVWMDGVKVALVAEI